VTPSRELLPSALWALLASGLACAPTVAHDPVPEAMEFDPEAVPPRVPQPTGLVVNNQTHRIDFSLVGPAIPADCAVPGTLSRAECEFDQYLQTLDGFPTVTPAEAPVSAALDPSTLTLGTNVVVVAASSRAPTDQVIVDFDGRTRSIALRPRRSWTIGESYWVGIRGYRNGVRAANGAEVVGSPTQFLLKQESPLTCGASDPDHVDPSCPAVALLAQTRPSPGAAARAAFQLEAIRLGTLAGGGWALMEAAGVPKQELAALWSFPIHKFSVPELDPTVGLVPMVTAPDEMHIAVQGTVDPDTLRPFVFGSQFGSVIVMDLTAAQGSNLLEGFPVVDTSIVAGAIVIKARAPFVLGHQYGVFLTADIKDARGAALVPSPVSVLLRLRGTLLSSDGHSTISTISDQDAAMLEVGRAQLATLFDGQFTPLTHVTREQLVYCFAFPLGVTP
jgi:hypothetical protein